MQLTVKRAQTDKPGAVMYRLTCRLELTQHEQELLACYGGTSALENLLQQAPLAQLLSPDGVMLGPFGNVDHARAYEQEIRNACARVGTYWADAFAWSGEDIYDFPDIESEIRIRTQADA